MLDTEGRRLAGELVELFGRGVDYHLDDEGFNTLALRAFAYQFARNEPYRAFAERRGRVPGEISHWSEIPAVPTAAFKEVELVSGDPEKAEAVFRTSGTTEGAERRGEHYILDLTLYHASLLPNFAAYLLPDGAELPMISLMPPSSEMVDSSLAHMISVVLDRLGAVGSESHATVEGGIDEEGLSAVLRRYEAEGTPVCILGTSFSFVHWTDSLRARGERFELAPGSRLMDTGGFKGRSREVGADELRATYVELLGIREDHLVNEYGMAEMCSQFYDRILRDHYREEGGTRVRAEVGPDRVKVGPPWVRSQVVDPETLEPVAPGEVGILRHYDLANLGSVIGIQTEDLAREVEGGFVLLGRTSGAPPRGCSIAMDILLEAVAKGS